MAAPQGTVRAHQQEQTVTLRVEGRATMALSLPLRRFAERCLAGGTTLLRIDLRNCLYMDSTFLGTLLTLQGSATKEGRAALVLISPSASCVRLLQQMGLNAVFRTETAEDGAVTWSELPAEPADVGSLKRNVAQAHEELANLPGPAGEQFRAVARCLAQAAEAEKPSPPPAGGPRRE
jgi:anti-anti-sigma factor